MSPQRDDYEEEEGYEEAPRSVFQTLWFRAVLAVLILAVAGLLALPYLQEWFATSSRPQILVLKPAKPAPPAPGPSAPAAPGAPPPAAAPAAPTAEPPPKVAEEVGAPAPKGAEKPGAPAAPAPKPAEKPAEPAAKPVARAALSRGDYWVQVGIFRDPRNATRLAARLNDQKYPVARATVTRGSAGGTEGNEVYVAGAKQRDVYDLVKAKGYRVDAVKGGAVVRPALPLRDAVALSKELTDKGMDVKIRRVGGTQRVTLHVVRVGGYADRKEAEAARKELTDKGMPGFIVKGAPR